MSAYDVFDAAGEFSDARTLFDSMTIALSSPRAAETSHDALEDFLTETGRELQRLLYQAHLDLRAHTERRGTEITDNSGTVHRRIESGHTRALATVFGQVTTTRMAYRAPGRENLYPADAVLNLPVGLHSHSLRRLAADEAVRGSYDAALDALTGRCGKVIGKRAAEQLTIRAAGDIDSYYQRLCPPACPDETLLVISTDGKGIVMRPEALREETRKAAEAKKQHPASGRLAPGEKPHRKRMATLGAVYDALPRPRTPDDVITLPTDTDTDTDTSGSGSGRNRERLRPVARQKWLTGSVRDSAEEVVARVFDHAEQRDPTHRRTWIALVDGAPHQLDLLHAEADRRGIGLNVIVDFVHVAEYVWKAARAFFASGDPAADKWVARHLHTLLQGHTDDVITDLDAQARHAGLLPDQRTGVDSCIGYLTAKKPYLAYDTALASGWPIATGVIEGACRHLIGDRLDITGARWGLDGAEAILKLRALRDNDDLDGYWAFHVHREHERVHQARYQHGYNLTA